jgi:hypothetical protein
MIMKQLKYMFLGIVLLIASPSFSSIYYVGQGSLCNGSNHLPSLGGAILAAAFNGTQSDEIRLTNTVSYLGSNIGAVGSYSLSGWNETDNGELTIIGGYSNCNSSSSSGVTNIGEDNGSVFSISDNSTVYIKNLELIASDLHGIHIDENSLLFLESVSVVNNLGSGIDINGGAAVFIDANSSIIQNGAGNGAIVDNGGGVDCRGVGSAFYLSGSMAFNFANVGANLYVGSGCYAQLEGGSSINGGFISGTSSGGGIFVDNGGQLFANGGSQRVSIIRNIADLGAALYVNGSGKATLYNTYFTENKANLKGSGLYATGGGTSMVQVKMDRVSSCPFLISCSEFENNDFVDNLIYIQNSKVRISRTIFEKNTFDNDAMTSDTQSLIDVRFGGVLEMNHINFLSNQVPHILRNEATAELSHITAVDNFYPAAITGTEDSFIWFSEIGNLRIENSIFQDTQGGQNASNSSPNISGKCNMVDNDNDWPSGSFFIGTAIFNNPVGGDARQQPNSDGVDMCHEDSFAWSDNIDIEYQTSPVNEDTNPQGSPGELGGFYDAGFDEVYANIGEIDLIYKNGFEINMLFTNLSH